MKISFPNCGSGIGIGIRAAINALLNWHTAKGTRIAVREKKRAANHAGMGLSAEKVSSKTRGCRRGTN